MNVQDKTLSGQEALSGLWYFVGLTRELVPGKLHRRILFDEPLVFGRTKSGEIFAYVDICPHRGAPLSEGKLNQTTIECPYHGWRFASDSGKCLSAPALASSSDALMGIGLKKRSIAERNGLVWLFHEPASKSDDDDGFAGHLPPDLGVDLTLMPKTQTSLMVECGYDEAVLGLVDPAHTPTVHRQWWWRQGATRALKTKIFEPTALGFRMTPHAPSSNSRIYKVIGGAPTTEIEFRLPGLRLEWIKNKRRLVFGMTAITPGEKGHIRISHVMFWDSRFFDLAKPFVQKMSDDFFGQDKAILEAQHLNLARAHHRPLFSGDPDVPAQWYFQLKKAWLERQQLKEAAFQNPLSAATLQWRT